MKDFKYPALNYNAKVDQSNDCSRLMKCIFKAWSQKFKMQILLARCFSFVVWTFCVQNFNLRKIPPLASFATTKRYQASIWDCSHDWSCDRKHRYLKNCTTSNKLWKRLPLVKPKMAVCVFWANGLSCPQGTNCTIGYCKLYSVKVT